MAIICANVPTHPSFRNRPSGGPSRRMISTISDAADCHRCLIPTLFAVPLYRLTPIVAKVEDLTSADGTTIVQFDHAAFIVCLSMREAEMDIAAFNRRRCPTRTPRILRLRLTLRRTRAQRFQLRS